MGVVAELEDINGKSAKELATGDIRQLLIEYSLGSGVFKRDYNSPSPKK